MQHREHALRWAGRGVVAVAAYAVSWVVAYALVNGDLDGELLVRYFILAWTGKGLERPFFTWLLSLVAFAAFCIAWCILNWRRRTASARRRAQVEARLERVP